MSLPFFYYANMDAAAKEILLDENTSKHIVSVLRMKEREQLKLTDGKGNVLTAEIVDDHKKHCKVEINATSYQEPARRIITIAISLIKNASRFEWFLEKATEIGVSEVIPLICERTEKEKFRQERMQGIIISAMLQSQQCWLPILSQPVSFKKMLEQSKYDQKFIAHCMKGEKGSLVDRVNGSPHTPIILIGPEGDFTKGEIDSAIRHHFTAVTLGDTRLRSETAGIMAAALLRTI